MASHTTLPLSDRLAKVFQDELDKYVQEIVIPAFVEALDLEIHDLAKVYSSLAQRNPESFGSSSGATPAKAAPVKAAPVAKAGAKAGAKATPEPETQTPEGQAPEYTEKQLLKLKIADLKIICDKLRVSKSGIKATLVQSILKVQDKPVKPAEPKVKHSFSQIKPVEIQVEKDDMGNLVFEDMVFIESYSNPAEKEYLVVGYKADGKVKNLTTEKIDRCLELGLKYNDLSNINDPKEIIILQKDEFGNIYYQDLIYDPKETEVNGTLIRYVIGYKGEDGTIYPLDAEHKEKCKRLGHHVK